MGVAFAEVSPDFRFCINTHCHCGAVFTAPGGIRYCHAGGVYAGGMGMGAIKRFHLADTTRVAGGTLWPVASGDALLNSGISP